jgi:hypothetical protein
MSGRLIPLLAIAVLMAGCVSLGVSPDNNASFTGMQTSPASVPISITWPDSSIVQGPVVSVDGNPLQSPPLVVSSAGANANVQLAAGPHNVRVQATEKCWYCSGGTYQYDVTHNFTVTMAAATPTVSISLDPQTPTPIDVPRGGNSPQLSFNTQGANTTSSFTITASNLPTGVSLPAVTPFSFPGGSGSANQTAALSAQPTAHGSATAKFTLGPSPAGSTPSGNTTHQVRVIPAAGTFNFIQAPNYVSGGGPPTPSSPDGRFTSSVSRMGASRIYTYDIKKNGTSILTVTVTNKTAGPSAANVAGLAFCSQAGRPTTTAIVLSDIDEAQTPTAGPSYDYRYTVKVISLDGTPPKVSATFEVRYQYAVIPRIGFSPDCSIVAGWGSLTSATHRVLSFVNALTGTNGINYEYDEPNATTTSFTATASISGANIVSSATGQQPRTNPAPQ